MRFIRLVVVVVIPLLCGLVVFLQVGDLTDELMPFSPDDPIIWSWVKGIGPAGLASYLVYEGVKRLLAKLGVKE